MNKQNNNSNFDNRLNEIMPNSVTGMPSHDDEKQMSYFRKWITGRLYHNRDCYVKRICIQDGQRTKEYAVEAAKEELNKKEKK